MAADDVTHEHLKMIKQDMAVPLVRVRSSSHPWITSHDLADALLVLTKKVERFSDDVEKACARLDQPI